MGYFTHHARARWAVPATAVAVIAGSAFVAGRSASAAGDLPARTPAQLLVDVQKAQLSGLSGTVVQTSNLGLPELPGLGGSSGGSSSLTSMVSGTHTWRLWYAGPTKARIALVGSLGESDVIRNGSDLWMWSSQDNTAVHRRLTAQEASGPSATAPVPSTDLPKTPQEAADRALAALAPTTTVTTSGTAQVAGRPAYELVLAPREAGSLVAQVRISVDAVEHIPLRVRVYSTKTPNPAFEVAFSHVSFDTPEARQFAFNPPPGATVTESTTTAPAAGTPGSAAGSARSAGAQPRVVGTGWSSIVVASVPELTGTTSGSAGGPGGGPSSDPVKQAGAQAQQLLQALPRVSGAWGSGRLLTGTLFSAVVADDGRVAIGAVSADRLYAALAAR